MCWSIVTSQRALSRSGPSLRQNDCAENAKSDLPPLSTPSAPVPPQAPAEPPSCWPATREKSSPLFGLVISDQSCRAARKGAEIGNRELLGARRRCYPSSLQEGFDREAARLEAGP